MNAPIIGAGAWAPDVAVTLDVLAAEIELSAARCIFLDRIIAEAGCWKACTPSTCSRST